MIAAAAPAAGAAETVASPDAAAAEKPSKRPQLPRELTQKSPLGAALFIGFSAALFLIPAGIAFWLATWSPWPVWARVIAYLPCCVLAAQGLHLLGWVGHEGFHFNLAENKKLSAVVGLVFSSMIMGFMEIGASISHKTHHKLTNQAGDPDIDIFRRFRNFWSRLLLGRVTCNRIYLRNTARMVLGREFPEYWARPPFRWSTMRWLACLNVVLSLAFISTYAVIAWFYPLGAIAAIAIPHVVAVLYTGLRSYVEHAGTRTGEFLDSRTRTAKFFSVWYYFNNYHMEHHLYPSVPCYRLPHVHAWLRKHGYFEKPDVPIEPTVGGAYAFTLGNYQYPEAPA